MYNKIHMFINVYKVDVIHEKLGNLIFRGFNLKST